MPGSTAGKPGRSRSSRILIILGVVAGALVLVLLAGGGSILYAAHQEEDDRFCSSCHTEPETTYVARSEASPATDLASFHHQSKQTRCIDCHSGVGNAGRLDTIMNLGVKDLVLYASGRAKQPAPLTEPIADANCLKCHADVPKTTSFQRHFHAFLARWQERDKTAATCVDCHSSHTTDGQAEIGFLQRERTVQVCDRCHRAVGEGG